MRSKELRVVNHDGQQFGVMPVEKAQSMANDAGLDLVEVAPDSNPPVARIMDFPKFKYEQEKKERESRKKQHIIHVKEVKIGPKIEEHDYRVKLNRLEKFLKRGDKAKITMFFRGRQMMHIDLGRKILDRVANDLSALGELESEPKLDGRAMVMIFKPKK